MRIKKYIEFLNENILQETEFVVNKKNNKFQLFINNDLVSESGFSIENPDKWFNKKYVTLFDLNTSKKFQNKGFAKKLLEEIFNYVKNNLKLNIITLNVYKTNYKAVNLYFKCEFTVLVDYNDKNIKKSYYSLVKNL